MRWGNGQDANGQPGYPQSACPHDAPTPASPAGQAPTPPYTPNAPTPAYRSGGPGPTPPYQPRPGAGQKPTQTPAQRLAEARRTPHTPRQTAHPDGTPAPLPATFGGESHAGGSCNPCPGCAGGSVSGYAHVNWNAIAWAPGDAQAASIQQFNSQYPLPAGDYWVSGPSACASPAYNSYSGGTYHVTCAATSTAQYDWRASSSAGQTARTNLINALANKSLAQAESICNSTPGIVAGSCTITLNGGNVKIMPDASKIQLVPQGQG